MKGPKATRYKFDTKPPRHRHYTMMEHMKKRYLIVLLAENEKKRIT